MRWENVKQFWEQWCRKYLSYERANRLKCQTGSECFEKCWWNGEKMGSWCPKQERHCYWKTTLSLSTSTSVTSPTSHLFFVAVSKNGHSVSFDLVGKINQWHWREWVSAIGAIILYPLSAIAWIIIMRMLIILNPAPTPLCNCSDNSGAPFWPEHRWGQQEFTAFPKHHLWPSHYSVALSITEVV